MCDKGNNVLFTSNECRVFNLIGSFGKRHKNIYKADIMSPKEKSLKYLTAIIESSLPWHKRLGHISSSTMNKLISKDLVKGLPTRRFNDNQVCGAYAQVELVKSSFKPKVTVSTTKHLQLLHMGLCGPMRV